MKIKVTEIECTANELRQSNTIADGLLNLLRGVFNNATSDCEDAISRQAAIEICKNHGHDNSAYYISLLPSVTPKTESEET